MRTSRLVLALVAAALVAVVVMGLTQAQGSRRTPASKLTLAEMSARLAGSPAPLSALHGQASRLLPGGLTAVRARLASLRGTPIVINKWASWCEPCRAEFGALQAVALSRGRSVAFLGIDSGDSSQADAAAFLRSHPVSYPSYYDPGGAAGLALTDSSFTPVTVFVDRFGNQYIHQGPYADAAALERDVRRYALDG